MGWMLPQGPAGWMLPQAPAGWQQRARRHGPLRFSELPPAPLLQPPPAMAAWLAAAIDAWWERSGQPDPYVVVVVSGDLGPLAAGLLGCSPACAPALRYVMVNPFGGRPGPGLALEEPAFLFPPARLPAGDATAKDRDHSRDHGAAGEGNERYGWVADDEPPPPAKGIGPLVVFLADLPSLGEAPGAVVAVHFLSRLPADRVEWRGDRWYEERIGAGGERVWVPSPDDPRLPRRGGPQRAPTEACRWLSRLLGCLESGTVAVVDEWGPHLPLERLSRVRPPSEGPAPVLGGLQVVTWAVL